MITIKANERNGQVVSIQLVADDDDLMLMTDHGKLIRMPASGISIISRNTQGVKLIGMDENEKVAAAARLAEKDCPCPQPFFRRVGPFSGTCRQWR